MSHGLCHEFRCGVEDVVSCQIDDVDAAYGSLASLREIVAICERTYCQTLGVEFMHISDPGEKSWIQERIEGADKSISFTPNGKKAILNKLIEGEGFEQFLNVKYTGTKLLGIGVMHKSNSVPVFSQDEAIEISTMRRG